MGISISNDNNLLKYIQEEFNGKCITYNPHHYRLKKVFINIPQDSEDIKNIAFKFIAYHNEKVNIEIDSEDENNFSSIERKLTTLSLLRLKSYPKLYGKQFKCLYKELENIFKDDQDNTINNLKIFLINHRHYLCKVNIEPIFVKDEDAKKIRHLCYNPFELDDINKECLLVLYESMDKKYKKYIKIKEENKDFQKIGLLCLKYFCKYVNPDYELLLDENISSKKIRLIL